jgi:hypothetical protein
MDSFNTIALIIDRPRFHCIHQSNLVIVEKYVEVQFALPWRERDGLSVEVLQEFEPRYKQDGVSGRIFQCGLVVNRANPLADLPIDKTQY